MASRLDFNFSQTFDGTIWNTLAVPEANILILEIRNEQKHEVRFAAFDYQQNNFLWKDVIFEETWWMGITAATPEVALLYLYLNTQNPDEKSLLAWHIRQQKVLWKLDHFSFTFLKNDCVYGQFTKLGAESAAVDILTGKIIGNVSIPEADKENILVHKPFQYVEGSENFETVKSFLIDKLAIIPVAGAEYLEISGLVIISYYVLEDGLTNYLAVFNEAGDDVLREKIDWQLKGIGLETFFLLSGCLFFVRNKCALVSYRIV